ncbi:MAG: CPBP family intramembrane metalloprotease [Chitinophagaceae bacterium]|nr:MAG: CPBP family intramembrane metalloprotease [Chitinophagaceae bacterium]
MQKTFADLPVISGLVRMLKTVQGAAVSKSLSFWLLWIGLLFLGGSFLVSKFPNQYSRLSLGVVGTIAAIVTIRIFLKTDNAAYRRIGLFYDGKSVPRFFSGYILGTVICAIMISILVLFSDLRLYRNELFVVTPEIILNYIAILPLAMMEELAFRSYTFMKINSAFNFRITQFIIAVAFAAYHIIGGQGILSALLGPGVWAYVFGLSTLRSGGIAMPLGIHVAANVSQALAGMKGKNDGIWLLDYPGKMLPGSAVKTETIGIGMHLAMLVIAVVITEVYFTKNKKITKLKIYHHQTI